MFCRPMELIMPPSVSHRRGGGLPTIGSRESPLTTMPPMAFEIGDILEFDAVAESSRGGDHRIGEFDAAQRDAKGIAIALQCAAHFVQE